MDSVKKMLLSLCGSALLIVGIAYLLEIFGIGFQSWVLFAVGVAVLVSYGYSKIKALLYTSFALLSMGAAVFLCTTGIIPNQFTWVSASYLMAIAVAVALCYIVNKNTFLLYTALVVAFFDIWLVLTDLSFRGNALTGYLFLGVGVLFVILFACEYKKLGYTPLILSVLSYLVGFANLAFYYQFINAIIFRSFIAVLFIIAGGLMVGYVFYKTKKSN